MFSSQRPPICRPPAVSAVGLSWISPYVPGVNYISHELKPRARSGVEIRSPFRVVETFTLDKDRYLGVFAIAEHASGVQFCSISLSEGIL